MTTVKFTVTAKIFDGVQTTEQQVERKYTIEWHKGYAGIRNEDGYFVQDISLKGLETKEERMQHGHRGKRNQNGSIHLSLSLRPRARHRAAI